MKIFLRIAILMLLTMNLHATILRCNNTPGMQGVYATFSSAVIAAQIGDTIHIEPSGIDYLEIADIYINKRLAIFGNGSNLSLNPGLQSDTNHARITMSNGGLRVRFNPASRGSYVSCNFGNPCIVTINTDSITFDKCYFSGVLALDASVPNPSQVKVMRSYCDFVNANPSANISFYNSILASIGASATFDTLKFVGFQNCIVAVSPNNELEDCIINNSVLTSGYTTNNSPFFNNCVISNNIFSSDLQPEGLSSTDSVNNQFIAQNSMFNPFPNYFEEDYYFKFKTTFNPGNIGPFFGNSVYTFGTIPAIPSIYQLTVPSTNISGIGAGNTLPIIISTRTNQ